MDINNIRKDFPILEQKINGKPFIYMDNAATAQRPQQVLETVTKYYLEVNSNIHRGAHYMANKTTVAYERAREKIRIHINASDSCEVIKTNGTTESINLVAASFGEKFIHEGDEIIVSEMEHHANIVPWQMLCERKKATIKILPFNEKGMLKIDELEKLITSRTRIIAVNHVSNTLGTVNPIKTIISTAHKHNIPVLIDGAQGATHFKIDVQELDCDFYAFSGHKMYGPTGIGILYGKKKWLEQMPPYMGGGEMIERVSFAGTTYTKLPLKFEPGTPNYVGLIGMGTAIDYINNIGIENTSAREAKLLQYATEKLSSIEGLKIYGEAAEKVSTISFNIEGIHFFDMGTLLDQFGIALRTGRMCTDPIMDHFEVSGMLRASFAFYNTMEEIDALYNALIRIKKMF